MDFTGVNNDLKEKARLMENFIYHFMEQINQFPQWSIYLFTFISGLIQVAFPPYPGEFILVLGGCIGHDKHLMHSLILFLTYWSAILAANLGLYELGARKGELVLRQRLVSMFINDNNRDKIRCWLSRYGPLVYLTAIYIPGMYLPTVFFSGVMKYKRRYALPGMMIATAVHDILLFFGGRYIGNNLDNITGFIAAYRYIALGVVLSVVVLYAAYRLICHIKRRAPADGA